MSLISRRYFLIPHSSQSTPQTFRARLDYGTISKTDFYEVAELATLGQHGE